MTGPHIPHPASMICLTVGCTVPGLFGFFVPGPLETPKHDPRAVQLQQAKAGAASLALGAVGAALTKTPWPFLVALLLVVILMWEYKSAPVHDEPQAV